MIVFPLFIDFLNYKENPVGFTIFICALIFILLLLLFLIIFPFAKRHYNFKNFQKIYYKEIRKIAEINDYYLINNLVIKNNNQLICRIYVIKDRYYRGAISGKKEDSTWFFYSNQKKQFEMDNPMAMNEKRLEKLSLVTNIDKSFFISILVINDNCVVKNANELNKNNSFIVSKKNLRKLIKNIEKRNVKNMDQKQLEFAVQDISRLYGKNKQKNDTGDDIY